MGWIKEYRTVALSGLAVLLFLAAAYFWVGRAEEMDSRYTYAEHLFREGAVSEIDIQIAEEDWQDMLENPLAEEYHRADIVINGETVGNAAIRTKGNTSLTFVASSDSERYSFKLDFDYYEDGGNYYGLKKLNLNNNYSDSSSMREYISYKILDGMGVPVPGCGYAHITVNGEEWGLYLAVEAVDEVFLQTHFEDASGDLYKPDGTGADLVYRGDDISLYTGLNPKTNENGDGSAVVALMRALESGEGLEETLDVDEALRYLAVNTALANFDSYLGGTTHNYYLYEQDGVFSILPWDYNLSFGGFGGGKVDIYDPVSGMGGPGGRQEGAEGTGQPEETPQEPEEAQEKEAGTAAPGEMPEGTEMPGAPGEMPEGAERTATPGEMPQGAERMAVPGEMPEGAEKTGEPGEMPEEAERMAVPGEMPEEVERTAMPGEMPEGAERTAMPGEMPEGAEKTGAPGETPQGVEMPAFDSDRRRMEQPEGFGGSGEKPLVTTLLADEEYLAAYEGYLREIAEKYLSQEYLAGLVTEVHALIAPYVEKDATAFYSFEEFERACSTDPADEYSLVYFGVNMAESILTQLAGGEPTFDTSSLKGGGMGGGKGFGGAPPGEMPGGGSQEEQGGENGMPASADGRGDGRLGGMPGGMPQEGQAGENGMPASAGGRGDGRPGGMGRPPGMEDRQRPDIREYLPEMAACGAVFAAGLAFTLIFRRKKELKPPKE